MGCVAPCFTKISCYVHCIATDFYKTWGQAPSADPVPEKVGSTDPLYSVAPRPLVHKNNCIHRNYTSTGNETFVQYLTARQSTLTHLCPCWNAYALISCLENETVCHVTCDGDCETENDFSMTRLLNGADATYQDATVETTVLVLSILLLHSY